ncbi:MAG: hypothetical protein GQ564_18185, partial [Bacteroidales bacterium]|nr:hypothetical protein [Bacteroidales bacterium]
MRKFLLAFIIILNVFCTINIEAQSLNEIQKLLADDGNENDLFGYKVSISGDYAIVGGCGNGYAYIYYRNEGGANNWGQVAKLVTSDSPTKNLGISVGIFGNYAIFGRLFDGAYIFYKDQGGIDNWGEVKKLVPSDESTDQFGFAVSISGDKAVVSDERHVYVFNKDNGGNNNWGEVVKITSPITVYHYISGEGKINDKPIGIYDDYVVIGGGGILYGFVYVYNRNQGGTNNWGLVTELKSTGARRGDGFGRDVSIFGDNIVVGAKYYSNSTGRAFVFHKDQGGIDNWGLAKEIHSSDSYYYCGFGCSVSVWDNYILIGSHYDNYSNHSSGTYIYYKDQGGINNWGELTKVVASDVESGQGYGEFVSISNRFAIVGSPKDNDNGENSGSAYVFRYGNPYDFNDNICLGEDFEYALISPEVGAAFRWQENKGSTWIDITGETNDTLIIPNVTLGMDGFQYRCIISGTSDDTTDVAALTVNPTYNESESTTINSGESYTFPDGTTQDNITSQIIYTSNLQTIYGCDSIIETTVNVDCNPVFNLSESDAICVGESYIFPDGATQNSITSQVIHVSNLQTVLGCDSIIETTVNVNPTYNDSESITINSGESYTFPDGITQNNITSQVVYTSNLQTVFGCDSIIETTVNVEQIQDCRFVETVEVCYGSYYLFPDGTLQSNITSQVVHESIIPSSIACDTIIETTVNVNQGDVTYLNETICEGETFQLGYAILSSPGLYGVTLTNQYGCD